MLLTGRQSRLVKGGIFRLRRCLPVYRIKCKSLTLLCISRRGYCGRCLLRSLLAKLEFCLQILDALVNFRQLIRRRSLGYHFFTESA